MKHTNKFVALVLMAVLALSALAGCAAKKQEKDFAYELLGIKGDTVVATAENVAITAEELLVLSLAYTQQNMEYAAYFGMDSETMWQMAATETMTMEEYILQYALEEAAFHSLVRYHADKEGVKLTQEDKEGVDEQMAQIQALADEADMELEEYMNLFFMTPGVLRRSMESEPLYLGLGKKFFGEDAEGYPSYEQVKADLEAANAYTVKHILLATVDTTTREPLDEAAAAQKKEQAQLLWDQLSNSSDLAGDFDKLMREFSEDPGLETNPDGYTFTDEDTASLDPAFDEAAKALKEGEMSGIVEGVSGYHIILRLPLTVDMEASAEDFALAGMNEKMTQWIEALDIQLNETGKTMQPKDMYNKALAYVTENSKVEEGTQPDTAAGDEVVSAPDQSAADAS